MMRSKRKEEKEKRGKGSSGSTQMEILSSELAMYVDLCGVLLVDAECIGVMLGLHLSEIYRDRSAFLQRQE